MMNNLLQHSAPSYSTFIDNQVLTESQLNAVLDHLNYQDKLSRVLLHGVGIVCGLQVTLADDRRSVRISGGVAVTTDGDLLKMDDTTYDGFRLFRDSRARYSRFQTGSGEEKRTVRLWELVSDTDASDVEPFEDFESSTETSAEAAVAVLYLENYLNDPEDCSPVDCDSQGKEVVNRLRLLLISPDDLQVILENDEILSGLLDNRRRTVLNKLIPLHSSRVTHGETSGFPDFKKKYRVNFDELIQGINQLRTITILQETFREVKADPEEMLSDIRSSFHNVQYIHDFYRDLVEAYNELCEQLHQHYTLCCPDPASFPKHILLGKLRIEEELSRTEMPGLPANLVGTAGSPRHRFYPSPVQKGAATIEKLRTTFRRLLLLIRHFRTEIREEIRITPSLPDDRPPAERAVPVYYGFEKEPEASRFYQAWNRSRSGAVTRFSAPLLNYHGYKYPATFNPLQRHLKGHSFYRVEGHLGHHVLDAHKKVQEIQKEEGLAFDIQQIAIDGHADAATIDYDKYRVHFGDLQVILEAWNEEQQCLIKSATEFLSGFSMEEPGRHIGFTFEYTPAFNPVLSEPVTRFSRTQLLTQVKSGTTSRTESGTKSETTSRTESGTTSRTRIKTNAVLNGFSTELNSLGATIVNSVNVSDSRNDILVKTRNLTGELVGDWHRDLIEATVNIPAEIISFLKETEDSKLTDIEDFTPENLETYIQSLKRQCQTVRVSEQRFRALVNKQESEVSSREWVDSYLMLFNRLSSFCCMIEKIKVLYETVLERKDEILKQQALNEFIKKHPGAEHKAGVSSGGTFILLYYSRNRQVDYEASGQELTENQAARFREINASLAERLGQMESREIHENIPHGTVVGDLCLPYICCSGAPSNTFIFKEQAATLRIPVDHVCVGEDEEADHIQLTVTPAGGEVIAYTGKNVMEGVIITNESGVFFDPNSVAGEQYGTAIRFTVNGQQTEPALTVYRKPKPEFEISENIRFKNDNTTAVVTFHNETADMDGTSFGWRFGDGSSGKQDAIQFTHEYEVSPGRVFEFEVELTASEGPCQAVDSNMVTIRVPDIEDPVADCNKIAIQRIGESVQGIDRHFKKNAGNLERAHEFYQNVRKVYEGILKEPEPFLDGSKDQDIHNTIGQIQLMIQTGIGNMNAGAERIFLLKIYYEMILLYFYLHECQDKKIDVLKSQSGRLQVDWAAFTGEAGERFGKEMHALLREYRQHEKLMEVVERLQERFLPPLERVMQMVIERLRSFIGG